MQIAYRDTPFSVKRLQQNFQEATFTREELIDYLKSLTTPNVKIALGVIPENNQITVVMLGITAGGAVQTGSDGFYSPIPCPPNCRTMPTKPKIIVSV